MSVISEQIERLKSLQEAMRLDDELGRVKCDSGFVENRIKIIDDAIDTIETLSTKIQAKNFNNGWILCEDKMPEDCKEYSGKKVIDVLVTTDNGKVTKVQRIHNTYNQDYWYWGRILGGIKAWMPLPKSYKESE